MASATGVVHASCTSSPELPTSLHQPVDLAGSSDLGGKGTRIRAKKMRRGGGRGGETVLLVEIFILYSMAGLRPAYGVGRMVCGI